MLRMKARVLLILLGLQSALSAESDAIAQDTSHTPTLLMVHQQSDLVREARASGSITPSQVHSGTAIIGIRREAFGNLRVQGWRVVTLEEPPRLGWVRVGAVTPFATRAKELKATAVSLRAISSDNRHRQTLPEIILTQENPAIQQAWREVAVAISENDTLPESERLPEPYFARAEIWASVNNYSDSLQDYLTGIKYARKSNRDLLSYSTYFDKLYDVAERFQAVPVPATGSQSEPSSAAREHYSHGNSKFFTGDLREAVDRFDSAVQLAPDQPLYWYFRALTYRRLGDNQRAQYDALMGAYFEREFAPWGRRSLDRALTRVQGGMRTWLESYRLGSPTNRLLRDYDIRLSVAGGIR